MNESEALVRLQEVDIELMRLGKTLRDMPQTKKLEAVRLAKKKLAGQLSQIVGQRKDCEMEIEEAEGRRLQLDDKVAQLQASYQDRDATYREVQDLEIQFTSIAKSQEKAAYQLDQLNSQLDKLQKAEANARAVDERLDSEARLIEDSYRADTEDIAGKVRELRQEREHCERNVSEDVLSRYATARTRFGGLAVETLRGNTPSICRVELRPSQFGDIRKSAFSIVECPYCHRILVTDGMFGLDD